MEGGITSVFGAKGDPSKGGPCGPGGPCGGKGPMKGFGMPGKGPPGKMGMKGGPPIGKGFGPGPPGKGGPGPGPGGVMPPPPVPTNRKTQLCVYYKEGRCTRGTLCNYAHGEQELIDRGRAAPEGRPPPPVRHPVNNRFDVRSGPQARAPRDLRTSRSRSQRRLKKVAFARSELIAAIERSDCSVRGPPAEAPAAAPEISVNGSTQKVGEDTEGEKEEQEGNGAKEGIEVEETEEVDGEKEKETAPKAATPPGPQAAAYLLSEDGASELTELYGIGAQLLRSMGWQPGSGVGANLDGELEPVSVNVFALPSTHFGRKDRRCLGRRKPKRFRDSDESSPSRTPSSSSSRSTSKSSQKSSKSSSPSSRKKKRRRRTKRKKRSSSSRRSSPSSSSSSSKSQRKRKKGKFTSEAPTANSGAAGAAAAANLTAAPQPAVVVEDPETAQAKKRVLAKLTELQKIEPKEQRAKEFRSLLRDWHPDKNPEKKDMATAVFQFLQKGKSLLNLK